MSIKIYVSECLAKLKTMPSNSVDAIVTDPPYGLSFMGKKWDYDVPSVEIWAECLRVLKPGGHLLAFAGTRTQHRMAVRIEDAGFEIRDMIAWVYGSGFPKSLDVSKAIDKAAGAEREVVGSKLGQPGYSLANSGRTNAVYGDLHDPVAECNITAPATEAAQQWQGWGTALKPSLEPITLARKPLEGTVAANVLQYGTGALNVNGCRIESSASDKAVMDAKASRSPTGKTAANVPFVPGVCQPSNALGRWPANFIHDGSEEVTELFPTTAPARSSNRGKGIDGPTFKHASGEESGVRGHNDLGGSAARFFYCAKAGQKERNAGCESLTGSPQSHNLGSNACARCGLRVKANGSGEKCECGELRETVQLPSRGNNHPTVKPVALMRYLCRLVTPTNGTVLDPFMGSGSTAVACVYENFNFIGVEMVRDYFEIAKARIIHAKGNK